MKEHDFVAPDLGNPFQFCDSPKPIEFELTPQERHIATMGAISIIEARARKNAKDKAAREAAMRGNNARLGIVYDDGPEAA